MLEKIDLSKKLPKSEYKARLPVLQARLHQLQHTCWDAKLATVVVFEGWDAAGKGSSIGKLTERLEPRRFELHAIRGPRTYETQMPWLWRFWHLIPNHGEMAIFDRSWYGRVLVERIEGLVPEQAWRRSFRDINRFERALADDRYQLVKLFLHIDKKEQKKRLKALEGDPLTRWKVEPEDWEHYRRWDDYLLAIEETLERTETEWGPWTIVEATDRRWARVKIFETLIGRIEERLEAEGVPLPDPWPERPPENNDDQVD